MKLLEDAILEKGRVIDNEILKVDSFLNHQVDPEIIDPLCQYFIDEFKGEKIDKILTIETSGLPLAYKVASLLGIKMVYAKKSKSRIVDDNVYTEEVASFTRGTVSSITVSKNYLLKGEKVLIIDDFLAKGNAAMGLINIIKAAGAEVVGFCAAIEKSFQGGRAALEEKGIKVVTGANIASFEDNKPVFAK